MSELSCMCSPCRVGLLTNHCAPRLARKPRQPIKAETSDTSFQQFAEARLRDAEALRCFGLRKVPHRHAVAQRDGEVGAQAHRLGLRLVLRDRLPDVGFGFHCIPMRILGSGYIAKTWMARINRAMTMERVRAGKP